MSNNTSTQPEANVTNADDFNDEELDSLLDSALEDYDRIKQDNTPFSTEGQTDSSNRTSQPTATGQEMNIQNVEAALQMMHDRLNELNLDDQMADDEQFKKLRDAARQIDQNAGDSEIAKHMAEALTLLSQSNFTPPAAGQLHQPDDDVTDQQTEECFGVMNNLMKTLVSRELFYPVMKDTVQRYPSWLEENKGKLDDNTFELYTKQLDIMRRICTEYEEEDKGNDNNEEKEARFQRIVNLVQLLQSTGQPPVELMSADSMATFGHEAGCHDGDHDDDDGGGGGGGEADEAGQPSGEECKTQ